MLSGRRILKADQPPRHATTRAGLCRGRGRPTLAAVSVDEVLPGLFRIEVPLPGSPLRSINSWVIPARPRSLVIDTGMNRPECEEALRTGLDEVGVDLERTDVFATHLHADHLGLVAALAADGARVLLGTRDAEIVEGWTGEEQFLEWMAEEGRRLGFPAGELKEAMRRHPGLRYSPRTFPPLVHVEEGDELAAGAYRLRAVFTPGHTPGHTCLWDEERRLLVSGDHILGDITPNITSWMVPGDVLGDYLASLEKVDRLGAKLALPGHRSIIRDVAGRIRELADHHQARMEEVVALLRGGGKTAYEVASGMTWDIDAAEWTRFPVAQKWFATGEAASHLQRLEVVGRAGYDDRSGKWSLRGEGHGSQQ